MKEHIGLARGTVKVVPHDASWHELFAEEADELSRQLGINVADIHHVGSTAIPGIVAKPIIDIAIQVQSLDTANQWVKPLTDNGYWDKGPEPDMPDRRFFAKGPEENRTVYLHVVTQKELDKLIKFRNALRSNSTLAEKYSNLKQDLAVINSTNRARYTTYKNDFIRSVLG